MSINEKEKWRQQNLMILRLTFDLPSEDTDFSMNEMKLHMINGLTKVKYMDLS